jgi:putative ABC transport system permease protein
MSWWSRIANVFRTDRLNREIDEELQSHLEEAVARGRSPIEAQRALGSTLRHRETSRDVRLLPWLDALRADVVFGWRQLAKHAVTSTAAILSLALALGACFSAFRLIDAMLLRPLPVAGAERLRIIARRGIDPGGHFRIGESLEYPLFARMRAALKGQAELIAISYSDRTDLTFGSDQEMEKAYRQYVSGWMFDAFGLQPVAGRLLTPGDDDVPGAHAYAVLSYDYWSARFGRDPAAVGRSFRMDNDVYQIVGVAPRGFTGTEPGVSIDIFVPTMMKSSVTRADASWVRAYVEPGAGAAIAPMRDQLQAVFETFEAERLKELTGFPQAAKDAFLSQTLLLEPATAGSSNMQRDFGRALAVLGVLVALVLLIACANVANLLTGQAAARGREMALRVSLGAGRRRLVQLVLTESAILACLAAVIGTAFAWWSAPFIVRHINPASDPARLALAMDRRVFVVGLALTLGVACLFGVLPAVRASMVNPMMAIKIGTNPHGRRRLMGVLIAVQVAFCVLVLFVGGLFLATVQQLIDRPIGFSAERLLALHTVAPRPQAPVLWNQVTEHLRQVPGVEAVTLTGFPLLSGQSWNGFVWVDGAPVGSTLAYFLGVSPGWLDVMRIPLIDGRDLTVQDGTRAAVVNQAFAKAYFNGQYPIGKWFEKDQGGGRRIRFQIVGIASDALYQDVREPITPTAYVPFASISTSGAQRAATFIVRTRSADPLALASGLRQEVPRARPEFRVSTIRTQAEIDLSQTTRERLLSTLAMFFSAVALLLSAIGLYGVLHYAVLERQREIGIRRAIGAGAGEIGRLVTSEAIAMLLMGAGVGLALGVASVRTFAALLYHVSATDPSMLAAPVLTMLGVAAAAAAPAILRALRVNPIEILRAE